MDHPNNYFIEKKKRKNGPGEDEKNSQKKFREDFSKEGFKENIEEDEIDGNYYNEYEGEEYEDIKDIKKLPLIDDDFYNGKKIFKILKFF